MAFSLCFGFFVLTSGGRIVYLTSDSSLFNVFPVQYFDFAIVIALRKICDICTPYQPIRLQIFSCHAIRFDTICRYDSWIEYSIIDITNSRNTATPWGFCVIYFLVLSYYWCISLSENGSGSVVPIPLGTPKHTSNIMSKRIEEWMNKWSNKRMIETQFSSTML